MPDPPFTGLLADRYGARPVVIGAGLLYAAGLGLAAIGLFNILGTWICCLAGARWQKWRVLTVIDLARPPP